MRPFAVAGLQMLVVESREDNLARMEKQVDELMHHFSWVQMVLFSELASSGYKTETAVPLPDDVERRFQRMAAKHGIWLLPGTLYERVGSLIYNTAPVIDPEGKIVLRYRKMFPFEPYERGVTPGVDPAVFDVPGVGRFGLSICYDMWFPETSRTLALMGAEVILHPTLTETIDRDVELAICRATAAMNQCYIIDVNGVGRGGNGRSIFIGPAGDVLHLALTAEEEIPIEIDLDRVRRGREVGLRGLGQPLKSFRDRKVQWPMYAPGARQEYLETLGPLVKPARGSRAGLDGHTTVAVPHLPT